MIACVTARRSTSRSSPDSDVPDAARLQNGRALIGQHRCNTCHNLDLAGRENISRIADQREDYLVKTLRDYKSEVRMTSSRQK